MRIDTHGYGQNNRGGGPITEKRGTNHGLHLVLTLLTCGMWAITGWPIAAAMGRKRTYRY